MVRESLPKKDRRSRVENTVMNALMNSNANQQNLGQSSLRAAGYPVLLDQALDQALELAVELEALDPVAGELPLDQRTQANLL